MPTRSTVRTTQTLLWPFFRSRKAFYSTTTQQAIPQLEVLDKMVTLAKQQKEMPNLDKTVFIGVQHLLETTGTLFQSLMQLGAKPEHMFFAGKCYSTSPLVAKTLNDMGMNIIEGSAPLRPGDYRRIYKEDIKKLWASFQKQIVNKKDIERVIILDDGGHCIEEMPKFVPFNYLSASIEQTRGGLYSSGLDNLVLPLIEVATSAVKRHIESPLIAEAILNRVKKILPELALNKQAVCGVVGNGAIGRAIAEYLLSLGLNVMIYDENPNAYKGMTDKKFYKTPTLEKLLANASHVFGCTGKDITKGIDIFGLVENDITFISCTSEDKEFLSLLKRIAKEGKRIYFGQMSDITCLSDRETKITILKAGFPINFDGTLCSVPSQDIEITRALLLGACIQAVTSASTPIDAVDTIESQKRQMLDPYIQQFALKHWLKHQPKERYSQDLVEKFGNIEWIKESSGGGYYPNSISGGFNIKAEDNEPHLILPSPTRQLVGF